MTEQLAYEIEQMYMDGFKPTTIAAIVGCSLETVYDWMEENHVEEARESDDYYGA